MSNEQGLSKRGNGGYMASPNGEDASFAVAAYTRSLPKIDCHDPEQLAQRTDDFFAFCAENGVIPLVETYCNAIGTPQRTVRWWRQRKSKAMPEEALLILDDAYETILSGIAMAAATGKINPVWSMFYLKVFGRYDDQPSKDAPEKEPDEHTQTAQDIMMKYQDMPDD